MKQIFLALSFLFTSLNVTAAPKQETLTKEQAVALTTSLLGFPKAKEFSGLIAERLATKPTNTIKAEDLEGLTFEIYTLGEETLKYTNSGGTLTFQKGEAITRSSEQVTKVPYDVINNSIDLLGHKGAQFCKSMCLFLSLNADLKTQDHLDGLILGVQDMVGMNIPVIQYLYLEKVKPAQPQ